MWTPVYHMPQRQLELLTDFVALTGANGTTLTLSHTHILYTAPVAEDGPQRRVPMAAQDVTVRSPAAHMSRRP